MNSKTKLILGIAAVALVSAGLAGAAVWWFTPAPAAAAHGAAAAAAAPSRKTDDKKKPAKYVTLDKVIVMLRRGPNEAESHYLSADLVLATTDDKEKHTKEHLPLLRSIAVQALSAHTMAVASGMTVDQYAVELNRVFDASYAKDKVDKPFSEVMIGKLIIE